MYLTSKDRLAEGRFGTMFKKLPAFAPRDELLDDLAKTMVEDQTSRTTPTSTPVPACSPGSRLSGSSSTTTSPSTTRRSTQQQADPDATVNFRTPRYDLDSLYGRGPLQDPQFYDPADRDKLLLTPNVNGVLDVPRDSNGRAIIPEPRNDENLIIVQLHKAVAQFHNRIVDYARAQGIRREWVFETARRLTRWHYQWAVTHDFLPRFVGDELIGPTGTVYKEIAGKPPVIALNYYRPTNKDGRPFMPVEFSVAAYRFGHTLIRPFYVINLDDRASSHLRAGRLPSISTAAARSPCLTWSWTGRTSSPSTRTSRPASRAGSTPSCLCRLASLPGPPFHPRTRPLTWPCATPSAGSTSACRRGSRSPGRCRSPSCLTRRSDSATIRDGAARRHSGTTS